MCSSDDWSYYRREASLDEPEARTDLDSMTERYGRLVAVVGIIALNALALLLNSLYTLFDIRIVNIVVAMALGLTCLAAAVSVISVYWKVTRLKKEKVARR